MKVGYLLFTSFPDDQQVTSAASISNRQIQWGPIGVNHGVNV